MIFVLNIFYSLFRTSMYVDMAYLFGVFAFGIIFTDVLRKKKIDRLLYFGLRSFVIPFAAVVILSCITAIMVWNTSYRADVTQSILRILQIAAAFFIAYISIIWYSKDSVKLLLTAGVISYLTVIVRYIAGVNGVSLESHGFIESCGLLFIYYLLSNQYDRKQKTIYLSIIGIVLFLGDKRICWVALVVTLILYFVLHKFQSRQMHILKIILIIYALMTFVYLWLIKSGTLETIFLHYGIVDNSRIKFWNYFSGTYELSPFYFGRGLQYTDNRMALSSTMGTLWISSKVGIHNDILRTYIGWGCIPFVLYYSNFFAINLNNIKKMGKQGNGWKYFALASYCFFNYMVDYMITDISFNICFFMVCLLLINEDSDL